jgi:hypothetical protein
MYTHVCPRCARSFASRDALRRHMLAVYPAQTDRGPTGTLASGQSGATPPVGTGGAATP